MEELIMESFPKLNKFNGIIKKFGDAGVPAVVVGGCVRDVILGVESTDVDLATPLEYKEVTELMETAGYKVKPTGIDHGTVTVIFNKKEKYEITTYRIDVNCNGRDAEVEFVTDLNKDLGRRDLTINAMAWDGNNLIDPYDALYDIRQGVIRTVNSAWDRFREDYLRPIRAYRFRSYLGFRICPNIALASEKIEWDSLIGTNKIVSFERVIDEFKKVFKRADAEGCEQFIKDMYYIGVLTVLFPELDLGPKPCHELAQSPDHHPEGDVLTHIAKATGCAKGVEGRWIAMLHDIAKPKTAVWDPKGIGNTWYSFYGHDKVGEEMIKTSVKDRLPLKNDLINKAALCTRYHLYIFLGQKDEDGNPLPPSDKQIRKVRVAMGEHLPLLRALGYADHMGRPVDPNVDDYFDRKLPDTGKTRILKAQDLFDMKDENGNDEWEPGPELGRALKAAKKAQELDGITDKAALMEIAYGTRNQSNSST